MGDPLLNRSNFFEDAFRVHLDSPEYISLWGLDPVAYDSPGEGDRQMSLHPTYHYSERPENLSCSDIQYQTYPDWLEGHERAHEARKRRLEENPTDNRKRSEELWPSFMRCNPPVHVEGAVRRTLLGNFRSAHFAVAVLGENFDDALVIDPNTSTLTPKTQELLSQVIGYGYESLLDMQLHEKRITVLNEQRCGMRFSIFDLEVR